MKDYVRPYIPRIILVVGLIFLSILGSLFLPRLMSRIVDQGVVLGDLATIRTLGIRMILLSIGSMALMVLAGHFSAQISMSFARDLRRGLFRHTLSLNFEEFEDYGAPSLLTRTTDDIAQLERTAVVALRPLVQAPLMFVGALFMAITTDIGLSPIILTSAPVLLYIITNIARRTIPYFREIRTLLDRINLLFRERLTGIRVIRAFHKEDYEEERFEKVNGEITQVGKDVNHLLIIMLPVFNLIFNFNMLLLLWFGAKRVDMGGLAVGSLMAYIQYITQIMFATMMFSMLFAMYPNAQASYQRVSEVLSTPIPKEGQLREIPQGPLELVFDHVSFCYPGAERKVLNDISFKVEAGKKLALIGGTGSGKSTVLKLINRFYDVTEGRILLNGVDIRELDKGVLRRALGYVPQQNILFNRSVRDNLALGRTQGASDDFYWSLLDVAQAQDFIENMEEGLSATVAQTGKNFSGGQKQRLSIARALAKEPIIYLFDDSFSALDFSTDKALRRELAPRTEDAITIIVAQRVMTVTDAHEILVMENGEIVGRGTHESLLGTNEIYTEIAESQLGEGAGREVQHA